MGKAEPSIYETVDKADEARREAEAAADVEAGRLIPNDEICDWLETWGTPEEKPAPERWFKS
jgi:predicted transcriptional regulator